MAKAPSDTTIAKRLAAMPITDEERQDALVVHDRLIEQPIRHFLEPEVRSMLLRVTSAARREYLRHFPQTRDIKNAAEWVTHRERGVSVKGRSPLEWVYSCLFCREPIASLGNDGVRRVPAEWYRKLDAHADQCACAIVLGSDHPLGLEPVRPWAGARRSRVDQRGGYQKPAPKPSAERTTKRAWPVGNGPGFNG